MTRPAKGAAFAARVPAALATPDALAPLLAEIEQATAGAELLPAPLFEPLLALLAAPSLPSHREAGSLIALFERLLEQLPAAQRARLAPALARFVETAQDGAAAAQAAAIAAAVSASDRAAIDLLARLAAAVPPARLPAVVHGLDWLAERAVDPKARRDGLSHLQQLQRHADPAVAHAASAALARRSKATR